MVAIVCAASKGIGRMARPEEIGDVVASPAASYITGCDVPVEGGSLVGI